jgi:hypothetical protein
MTTRCCIVLFGLLLIQFSHALAAFVLDADSGNNTAQRTWTVTNLDDSPPTLTSNVGTDGITGDASGAGSLSGQSFSVNFVPVSDWNSGNAQTAITGGTFENYIAGLNSSSVSIDGAASAWGVDSGVGNGSRLDTQGEALVLTVASNISEGFSLEFLDVGFTLDTVNDRADFVIYDVSENVALVTQYDVRGLGNLNPGGSILEDGDLVVIGVGASNGDNVYRFNTLTADVSVVVPQPSTGEIVLDAGSGDNTAQRTWTVTNLDNYPPTLVSNVGTDGITGDASGAGSLSGQSFSVNFVPVSDWNSGDAQTAITGGTFEDYIAGLNSSGILIDGAAGGWGVDSGVGNGSRLDTQGEALVLTVSSNLGAGSLLEFLDVGFRLGTANDRADFVIYDVSEDVALVAQYDVRGLGNLDPLGSILEDGDLVIIGVGASNGGNVYQFNTLTVNVSAAVPEPSTAVLAVVSLMGFVAFGSRRRKRAT